MVYSLSSPGITETLFVPSKIILSVVNLIAFGFGVASGLTAILVPPIKIHLYVKCIIFQMKRPSLLCEMVFFEVYRKLILCKMHSSLQKCACHFHISSDGKIVGERSPYDIFLFKSCSNCVNCSCSSGVASW